MRVIAMVLLSLAVAGAAHAASLTLESDKATYQVGETITLTLLGDPMDDFDHTVLAMALYDAALTDTVSSSQTPIVTQFGMASWTQGSLVIGDGFAELLNQNCCIAGPGQSTESTTVSTATLVAEAAGVVDVVFETSGPEALRFFGLSDAPGTSFTIVPEPGAAALIALGLAGLVAGARRRG